MKRFQPKLTALIALLACLSFFGCKNDSSDPAPVQEHYSIYTLGQLYGRYGALLEKETTVKTLNKVPNSLTMLYDIPSDKQQDAWLHEAFESGIPIGLLDATEEDLIKFSKFFELDIDFTGALANNSANPSNVFIARKDDFGNIYSLEAGFDSLTYEEGPDETGTEVIPPEEEISDTPNQNDRQTSEAAIANAVIKELLKWVFVDSPKMMAETIQTQKNSNGNSGRAAGDIDLQKLATAHSPRIIIPANQANGEKGDLFKFPIIVIDYTIYSLHDFNNNRDYYVMEKNMTRDASPYFEFFDQAENFPGTWNKIIHWNAEVTTEAELVIDPSNVKLTHHHPETGRSQQQVTETFNWSLGANVGGGYKFGKGGSISAGINAGFGFSKSNSWTLKDLEVTPSLDGHKLKYNYRIPMKEFVPNKGDPLSKVPEIARSTLATKEMWLWTVENPGESLKLKGSDKHTVGRRQYSTFAAGGQKWRYHSQTANYSLEMRVPPHFTLSTPKNNNQIVLGKNGNLLTADPALQNVHAQIGVFAHQAWTLESNQGWLKLGLNGENKSKVEANDLTNGIELICEDNGAKTQRSATLTAKTTINGKEQVLTCEVIQAGNPDGLPEGETFRVSSKSIAVDQVVRYPEIIKLSAADNWEAEAADSWCRIYQLEGGPCKDQEFKIKASTNTTGADRSTVVTFTSMFDRTKTCTVKVKQYAD